MNVDIMHYLIFALIVIGVGKCDETKNDNEIKALPEASRRMLLDNVAKRLLKDANGTATPSKSELEISDDKLSEKSNLVHKIIEEEKVNLQNSSKRTASDGKKSPRLKFIRLSLTLGGNNGNLKKFKVHPKVNTTHDVAVSTKVYHRSKLFRLPLTMGGNNGKIKKLKVHPKVTTIHDDAVTAKVADQDTTKDASEETPSISDEKTTTALDKVTTIVADDETTTIAMDDTTTPQSVLEVTGALHHVGTTILSEPYLSEGNPTTTPNVKEETNFPEIRQAFQVSGEDGKAVDGDLNAIASKIPKHEILKHLLQRFGYYTIDSPSGKVYEVFEQKNKELPFTLKDIEIQPTSKSSSSEESSSSDNSFETTLMADKINVNRGVKPELMKVLLKFMGDVYNKKSVLRNIARNTNSGYTRRSNPPNVKKFRAFKPTNLDIDYFDKMNDDREMFRRGNIQRTKTGNSQVFIRMINVLQDPRGMMQSGKSSTTKIHTTKETPHEKNHKSFNESNAKTKVKLPIKGVPIKGPKIGIMSEEKKRDYKKNPKKDKSRRHISLATRESEAGEKMWLDSFLTVTKDIIRNDVDTFTDYDWLGTTVDVLAALAKLNELLQREDDNIPLNKDDKEVLDFTRIIFKTAFMGNAEERQQFIDGRRTNRNKIQYMIIQNKDATENIETKQVISQLLKYYADKTKDENDSQNHDFDLNMIQNILTSASQAVKENKLNQEFKTFLAKVGRATLHLHLAVIEVMKDESLRDQAFFFQLKENYLEHMNDQELIGLLVHLFTSDCLQSVGKSYRSGVADNPDLLGKINKNEFDKAVDSVAFTLRLLNNLNLRGAS